MDSPLMPTLKGHLADSSDLMADLSLMDGDESFMPSSPATTRPPHFALRSTSPPSAPRGSNLSTRPAPPSLFRAAEANNRLDQQVQPQAASKPRPRFSLFAPLRPGGPAAGKSGPSSSRTAAKTSAVSKQQVEEEENVGDDFEGDQTIAPGQGHQDVDDEDEVDADERQDGQGDPTIHASTKMSAEEREDKLRESLYELRAMNEVFDGFLEALEAAKGHNERLETRVKQTKSLLDHYTQLLGQTHHTERLLSNPAWTGLTDENARIEAELAEREAEAERQRIAEERAAEAARLAEEERARKAEEAALARERAGAQVRGRGRGRGWGGTTTGLRGGRGTGSGIPTTSRIPSASSRTASTAGRTGTASGTTGGGAGTGVKRTVSGTTGSSSASGGVGSRWADVKSSGYGASGRRAA